MAAGGTVISEHISKILNHQLAIVHQQVLSLLWDFRMYSCLEYKNVPHLLLPPQDRLPFPLSLLQGKLNEDS